MTLDEMMTVLCRKPDSDLDLAEVALQLARDEFSHLDVVGCLSEFDAMAREAGSYARGNLSQRVSGLCRYVFHELGFHGNTKDYYDPANSYLHLVLERRTGIPISLSAVTMAIGRRIGLNVQGVGLPGHFIVRVGGPRKSIFLDPFHGGRQLTRQDCVNLVRQSTGMAFDASALNLRPLPLGHMVQRMLGNLRTIYLEREDHARMTRVLFRMLQLQPENASLHRDMGKALLRSNQPGKAIDFLGFYLRQTADEAADADNVAALLREAVGRVSAWN